MVRQEKVKVMRIREECEVMKKKILNPVAVIATIEEEMDIDIEDPEEDRVATKTQTSFSGHKSRNEMKKENLLQSKKRLTLIWKTQGLTRLQKTNTQKKV